MQYKRVLKHSMLNQVSGAKGDPGVPTVCTETYTTDIQKNAILSLIFLSVCRIYGSSMINKEGWGLHLPRERNVTWKKRSIQHLQQRQLSFHVGLYQSYYGAQPPLRTQPKNLVLIYTITRGQHDNIFLPIIPTTHLHSLPFTF